MRLKACSEACALSISDMWKAIDLWESQFVDYNQNTLFYSRKVKYFWISVQKIINSLSVSKTFYSFAHDPAHTYLLYEGFFAQGDEDT